MINNKGKLIKEISSCMKSLDKAIDMHKMHLDDPNTATPVSQLEMNGLMLGARNCILSRLRIYEK